MAGQQSHEIKVEVRTSGKHFSRSLRSDRKVPAVVYGPKVENQSFWLNENDAVRYSAHHFENSIFVLKSEDKALNGLKVLKKDVDWHPVSRRPVHMDFYALDMTRKVRVNVELKFTGRAEGQKEGGILNIVMRDIEIECLPTEIPDGFEVDITHMQLNDVMHVSDVQVPETVRILSAAGETICTVSVPKEEEVAAPVADAAAAAPAAGATPAAAGAAPEAGKAPAKS